MLNNISESEVGIVIPLQQLGILECHNDDLRIYRARKSIQEFSAFLVCRKKYWRY